MGITSPSAFTRIPTRAIGDSRLTHAELRVLGAICRYADNVTCEAYPRVDTIKEAAGVSLNRVRAAIRKLEELRYIDVVERRGCEGGQRSNVYCVLF